MSIRHKLDSLNLRKLFIFFIYFFSSWVILLAFISFPRLNGNPPSMFSDMVYGKAHQPFVYRTLVPSTVRMITEITPESLIIKVERAAKQKRPLSRLVDISQIEDEYVYEYMVALAIIFGCFFGFAFVIRRLIRVHYDYPGFISDLAPLGALLITPAFFRYDNYLYDPATILLFASGLLAVSTRRRVGYYLIFALACLNKETALLLSGVFLVFRYSETRRLHLAGHILLQGLIWISARAFITNLYQGNPGGLVEFHLFDHNLTLFAYAFRAVYFIVFVALWVILIRYRWKAKPILLRRGFLITFVPLLIFGMLFGYIDEVRIFYEAFPFAFLLALPTVVDQFGGDGSSINQKGAL